MWLEILLHVRFQQIYVNNSNRNNCINFPRDRDEWGDLLTKFEIRNATYPPSVVSRGNRLYIKVSAKRMRQSVVFMEVVASKCTCFFFSLSFYDFGVFLFDQGIFV